MVESPVQVELGCVYPVPCVEDYGRIVPVFPRSHADQDPEFFTDVEEHYHVDNRFVVNDPHTAIRALGKTVFVQDMACIKEQHVPPQNIIWLHLALLKHFADTRIKGNVCPHKGMPIINGTCAGHGLKWNHDGYLKHKGPFKLRWMGNAGIIDNLKKVHIPITEEARGPFVMDIIDREGEVVFTHTERDRELHAIPGDSLMVHNKNIEILKTPDTVELTWTWNNLPTH